MACLMQGRLTSGSLRILMQKMSSSCHVNVQAFHHLHLLSLLQKFTDSSFANILSIASTKTLG